MAKQDDAPMFWCALGLLLVSMAAGYVLGLASAAAMGCRF